VFGWSDRNGKRGRGRIMLEDGPCWGKLKKYQKMERMCGLYIPRFANDLELRCSSCMAGSSEIISPF